MSDISETEINGMSKEQHYYLRGYADGQSDTLDKISAEIEERVRINQCLNIDKVKALCWCLDVIDKYKAETPKQESNSTNKSDNISHIDLNLISVCSNSN